LADDFEHRMAKWAEEKAVETVLWLLNFQEQHGHPFEGTSSDLAHEMDMHPGTFGLVLVTGRSPEFVDKHGYVIPYVMRGPGPKHWSAVASKDPDDLEVVKRGERIRKDDAITAMQRVLAQSEYRAPTFDGRTKVGRRERDALVQLEAALISLEQSNNSGT
jgi:hypothetical protein